MFREFFFRVCECFAPELSNGLLVARGGSNRPRSDVIGRAVALVGINLMKSWPRMEAVLPAA